MKTEKALQNYMFRECAKANIYCRKVAMVGRRGFPDALLIWGSHNTGAQVVYVEVKSPTGLGELSALQVHEIKTLRSHGAVVYVVQTKEDVDVVIKELIDGDADGGGRPPV